MFRGEDADGWFTGMGAQTGFVVDDAVLGHLVQDGAGFEVELGGFVPAAGMEETAEFLFGDDRVATGARVGFPAFEPHCGGVVPVADGPAVSAGYAASALVQDVSFFVSDDSGPAGLGSLAVLGAAFVPDVGDAQLGAVQSGFGDPVMAQHTPVDQRDLAAAWRQGYFESHRALGPLGVVADGYCGPAPVFPGGGGEVDGLESFDHIRQVASGPEYSVGP